ncbi:hypothetical protein SH2C18_34990 [Clostridium sediminicola]
MNQYKLSKWLKAVIIIEALNKICKGLNCQPGDNLEWSDCDENK